MFNKILKDENKTYKDILNELAVYSKKVDTCNRFAINSYKKENDGCKSVYTADNTFLNGAVTKSIYMYSKETSSNKSISISDSKFISEKEFLEGFESAYSYQILSLE